MTHPDYDDRRPKRKLESFPATALKRRPIDNREFLGVIVFQIHRQFDRLGNRAGQRLPMVRKRYSMKALFDFSSKAPDSSRDSTQT